MKKIITLLAGIGLFFAVNTTSQAQVRLGGGLFYGSWLNNPGINLRADLGLFEGFSLVPMVDLSVPRFSTGTFLNSASVLLQYRIEVGDEIFVYPIVGGTMKSYLDFDRVGYDRVYHRMVFNPTGGAGGRIDFTKEFALFGELRLELGTYNQAVATFGVLIRP